MSEQKIYAELINHAQLCARHKQWHEALDLYKKALALKPDEIDVLFTCAQIRCLMDNYTDALADYDRILKIDPACSKVWFRKGLLLGFQLNNSLEAIASFTKVSSAESLYPAACFYKGILYYNIKEYKNSLVEYEKALKVNPGYTEVYYCRALNYEGAGEYFKAYEDYQAALQYGFDYCEVYYNLGLFYARFGNFEQAREEILRSHTRSSFRDSGIQETNCNYFKDNRPAATDTLYPDPGKIEKLSDYLEQGFVRYANYYFRHTCPGCKACIPLRVLADQFIISRSLKRTLKRNSDLHVVILDSPCIDPVRTQLFEKYNREKHKIENTDSPEQNIAFRHLGFKNSYELDVYLDDKLLAVHIVDAGSDALYAAFLYYDTSYMERRLGVFCIAKAIEFAAQLGKSFYYMGWYIENLPVMSYKKQFRPNQLLIDGRWKNFC